MAVLPELVYCEINILKKGRRHEVLKKWSRFWQAVEYRIRINTFCRMCGIVDGHLPHRNTTKRFAIFRRTPVFAR
jgi:hypothetical protein